MAATAFDNCGRCGGRVRRSPSSREVIICHPCRRDEPVPYGPHSARSGESRRNVVELECCVCGAEYVRYDIFKASLTRPCCSLSCAQRLREGLKRGEMRPLMDRRTMKRVLYRSRRAVHDMTWDAVPDEEIFERDGWRCQIPACLFRSRVIPRGIKFPDPQYRTVDHVVPLSLGGDDTAANKRAAHLRCNTVRGNRMGAEQLPLFGALREVPVMVMAGRKQRTRACRRCGDEFARDSNRVYCEVCREFPKPGRKLKGCRSCAGSGYEHAAGCLRLLTDAQRRLLGLRMSAMRSEGLEWKVIADVFGYKSPGAAWNVMAQALNVQAVA